MDNKIQILKQKLVTNLNINNDLQPRRIKYEIFRDLKLQNFLNIMYFFDTNDILRMITLNREIKNKVIEIIKEQCKVLLQSYERKYLLFLKVEKGILIFKKTKKNKKLHLRINLVIISKIVSEKLTDKSVAIGYKSKFPCDIESFKNVFKFDVVSPGPLSFWIMREYTNVNFIRKLTYSFIKTN